MIRRAALVLALLLVARVGHADGTITLPTDWVKAVVPPQLHPSLVEYERAEASAARRLRNAGIGLTVVGIGLTIMGSVLVVNGFCFENCRANSSEMLIAGSTTLALGQLSALIGPPLWSSGQAKASLADRAALTLSVSGARLTF